jgi:DNA-binding response OmpR family regulator
VIPRLPGPPRDQPPPLVLIADEDAQLVDTLVRALQSVHFRVTTALDGDDALRRVRAETPELVIASWRLPRRSGLELCDTLRREPDHGDIPVLLLAANPDTEVRVEALAHGADDVLAKPVAAREVIARAQRLVLRARQVTRHRRRAAELERDLHRQEGESRRAREQAAEERQLRTLASGLASEWLRALDVDDLDMRILREACQHTGARSAALLTPAAAGAWSATAVRGDLPERWQSLSLPAEAACLEWVGALRRPVRREELERLPGMSAEVTRLATHGVALLAPLVTAGGSLEALLVCEDRPDGGAIGEAARLKLEVVCTAGAATRLTARRFREQQDCALELIIEAHEPSPRRHEVAGEARRRLVRVARVQGLNERECARLELVLGFGPWVWSEAGRVTLAALAAADPSARFSRLRQLLLDAHTCARGEPDAGEDELAWLAAAGLRYESLRLAGRSEFESWRTTAGWLGVATRPGLRTHFPEALEPSRG